MVTLLGVKGWERMKDSNGTAFIAIQRNDGSFLFYSVTNESYFDLTESTMKLSKDMEEISITVQQKKNK